MIWLKIKRLDPDLPLPKYHSTEAAGLDLMASEDITFLPDQRQLISTGIQCAIPKNHVGIIKDRSGMAVKGWEVHAGVIDSDYRGEIKVLLENKYFDRRWIKRGDRIAQLLIMPIRNPLIQEVDSLDETDRGFGGFGSTD